MAAQESKLAPLEAETEQPAGQPLPELRQAGATILAARSASACPAALQSPQQGRAGRSSQGGWLHGHGERAPVSEPDAAGPRMEIETATHGGS